MKMPNQIPLPWRAAVLLLFLFIVNSANGQVVRTIGLAESIRLSVLSSKTLRISRAEIEVARARLLQAQDRMIPNVGVSGSYYRLNKPGITLGSGLKGLIGGSKSQAGSGGTSNGNTNASSSQSSVPNVKEAILAQASFSEPIFAGYRTRYAIASEKYLLKAAELSAGHNQAEVALNTAAAFYNIYKLQANKLLLEQSLQEQTRRVSDFGNLERNGLLTRNDLLKAEVQQSNIKLSLLDASSALNISLYNLRVMLGLPDSIPVQIDTTHLFSAHVLKSRDGYIQDGLEHRLDLESQGQQTDGLRAAVKGSKSGYYPSLSFSAGYIDAWIPNLLDATNVVNASLGLRYSLTGLFTTKHLVQEAKANLNRAVAGYDQLSDNIRMTINQNYLNFEDAIQRIDVTSSSIVQADENYRITKNKYANSLSTLTDLLDADIALLQTRINLASAKADAEVAWFNLVESSGQEIKF